MDIIKIALIGGGNMGEVILSAILSKGLSIPNAIWVSDIKGERRQYLKDKYSVTVTENNQEVAGKGDVLILAIEYTTPQLTAL